MQTFALDRVRAGLRGLGLDGWLLYDFRGINPLAARVAGTAGAHRTRRWFYFVPARGEPRKLVHRIEPAALDHLPGSTRVYLTWQELEAGVSELLAGAGRVAMEYSPRNGNPYLSRVDGGTLELVRACGVEVVSSGDLIQEFEATWDDDQWALHLEAARHTDAAFGVAWTFIAGRLRAGGATSEMEVQARLLEHFAACGLVTDSPPNVSVWEHAADSHYSPTPATDRPIGPGTFLLIDLWGKLDRPRAVYSDLTRVAFVGEAVPPPIERAFGVVREARDEAIGRVRVAFARGDDLKGWQVDEACRGVVERAGYGPYFTHRTGHNIGEETHGNGAHIDGLETRDDRSILRRTCFSIEPGIYLPGEFGVRTEVNVFVAEDGAVHVTGGPLQEEVHRILP